MRATARPIVRRQRSYVGGANLSKILAWLSGTARPTVNLRFSSGACRPR